MAGDNVKKKSKSDKKVKVSDLQANTTNPKGGTTTSSGIQVALADGSVRTISNTSTTDVKFNKN